MLTEEQRLRMHLARAVAEMRDLEELSANLAAQAEAVGEFARQAQNKLLAVLGSEVRPTKQPTCATCRKTINDAAECDCFRALGLEQVPPPAKSGPRLPSVVPAACEYAACDGSGMRLEGGAAVPCSCGGRP